jgi:predicted SAM-dependent methyltransferase
VNRLNLGCGSVIFEGWDNADINIFEQQNAAGEVVFPVNEGPTRIFHLDITQPVGLLHIGYYDYIFCNHMLSCFSHHELPHVLINMKHLLQTGGVAHILVPHAIMAMRAFFENDVMWFPQGSDMPEIDERFCTFLPWFGESKSIFTPRYLLELGRRAGFRHVAGVPWGKDEHDDREKESLVVEFTR